MSEPDQSQTYGRKGGASGPRVTLRKKIQAGLLVGILLFLFTGPASIERRPVLFGTMIVVVLVDLVMLWRGDLEWTHFQNRTWSLRINAILLAIAAAAFAYALTDRF